MIASIRINWPLSANVDINAYHVVIKTETGKRAYTPESPLWLDEEHKAITEALGQLEKALLIAAKLTEKSESAK